jgi:hypothetical protein
MIDGEFPDIRLKTGVPFFMTVQPCPPPGVLPPNSVD